MKKVILFLVCAILFVACNDLSYEGKKEANVIFNGGDTTVIRSIYGEYRECETYQSFSDGARAGDSLAVAIDPKGEIVFLRRLYSNSYNKPLPKVLCRTLQGTTQAIDITWRYARVIETK